MSAILAAWPRALRRPWVAALALAVLAALVLALGLGRAGWWEPLELAKADAALARIEHANAPAPRPVVEPSACLHAPPPGALARSLPERALAWSLGSGRGDEVGLRLPNLALALLTLLGAAGLAARLAGARAAALCGLLLLSFPLFVLQARQLLGELGTAAGATLTLYGLVSLRLPGASLVRALRGTAGTPSLGRAAWHLADDALSLGALGLGLLLGLLGGGVLLGVVVPLGAFAAATGAGAAALAAGYRLLRSVALAALRRLAPRRAVGRTAAPWLGEPAATWLGAKSLIAAVAALGALYVLVDHAIDLGPLEPGTRQILGRSLLPTPCYSTWLGGIWQSADDLRVLYDSVFEQVAFGTYPWGLLAPLAMAALLLGSPGDRRGGALALAWAVAATLATSAFQRKVGFALFAAFPALALAPALWLDRTLRASFDADASEPQAATPGSPLLAPLLVALFFALGALTLGKDVQAFPDKLASLLVGDDTIKYPAAARWLWLPSRVWVLLWGLAIAAPFSWWIWRGQRRTPPNPLGLGLALLATAALAAFWSHGWHASLSRLLSSKGVFATYHELRRPQDRLVIYGDLGNAPRYYARGPYESVTSREQLQAELTGQARVLALVPAFELCFLHRATSAAGAPLIVLDNDNPRTLLVSNRAEGAPDRNPLRAALLQKPPPLRQRPESRIVYDDRIELLGWDVPASVRAGASFEVTLVYKILAPVGGSWRVFMHFDRPGGRFLGDHVPIDGRCPTSDWQAGDIIVDRVTVAASGGAGDYTLWTGFFTGTAPSWQNLPISAAPASSRDPEHRAKIATIAVR